MKTVGVMNPLPAALAHYTEALREVLEMSEASAPAIPCTSFEVGRNGEGRLRTLAKAYGDRSLIRSMGIRHVVVTWPALGYLDRLRWTRLGETQVHLVIHDPEPLRRQHGLGELSSLVARRWANDVGLVCHSTAAQEALAAKGLHPAKQLPHPMRAPRSVPRATRTVLVLGQYKPSRNLRLLRELGPSLRSAGLSTLIVGRGWPNVPGWEVEDRFVSEAGFEALLLQAGCLLLPYHRLFQSGVAVRAAELGVPVVGPAGSNIEALFGQNWAGVLSRNAPAEEWLRAIENVLTCEADDVLTRAKHGYQDVIAEWGRWVGQI